MVPLTFGKKEEQIFLGREIAQHRDYSEGTAIQIDKEVKELVESANNTAQKLLSDNVQVLHEMANALLERETIVQEDIQNIIEAAKSGTKPAKENQETDDQVQVEEQPAEEQAAEPESPEAGSDQKAKT